MLRLKSCLMCLLMVSVSPLLLAEENAGPRGFSVLSVIVKQGGGQTFEQAAAKFKAANEKLNMPSIFASSPGIGDNRLYTFAQPFDSYAELAEQRNVLVEAFGEEEAAKTFALLGESVESLSSFIAIPRPDLGIAGPEMDTPPEIVLSITITVKQGRTADLETYMGKVIEATRAVSPDLYWDTFSYGIGGPANTYGIRINQNWADLDTEGKSIPMRLNEHFGKRNGERIQAEGQDAIEDISFVVRRIRADLGHMHKDM